MQQPITATNARINFSDLLNQVQYLGKEFIVEKQGKAIAVISPPKATLTKAAPKFTSGTDFLAKLSRYNLKGAPRDLAQNLDKYAWE